MTEKVESRALLSRIDMFITRAEFAAERIKSTRPGSTAAAVANDMLVASHLVKQLVEHVPDVALVERCLVAGYGEVKAEWETASREDKPEAQQLCAQMKQLDLAISHVPDIIAKLAAAPTPTDSVDLTARLAPIQLKSLQ